MALIAGIECDTCGEVFGTTAAYAAHQGRYGCRNPRACGMTLWVVQGKSAWHLPPGRDDGQIHD